GVGDFATEILAEDPLKPFPNRNKREIINCVRVINSARKIVPKTTCESNPFFRYLQDLPQE
ncbi:MAG: hypothetical protein ACK48K_19295, partial [Planctomycetota bacterium]